MVALVLVVSMSLGMPVSSAAPGFASECAEPSAPLTVGRTACVRLPSEFLGSTTAFSYYIPPACDPEARPKRRCPVLYWLHGTGGSYKSLTGGLGPAIIKSLTSGPPIDPNSVPDPWNYSDPSKWVPKTPIDMIVVGPHGNVVPGGYGPVTDTSTGWADWNPRYAAGGDSPRYDTPAPRARSFLTRELVPFIDAHFPTVASREGRSINGVSLGGFGALQNGLARPDLWSSIGAVSGLVFTAYIDAGVPMPVAPPSSGLPYTRLPGATAIASPQAAWDPTFAGGNFTMATVGFGDLAADNTWWRGYSPSDLAPNARAYDAAGQQVVHIRYFHGDAIPRRAEDLQDPAAYASAQAPETMDLPTMLLLEAAFDRSGVRRQFEIHPGIHSTTYWNAYMRKQLEAQYAQLDHGHGVRAGLPEPVVFDFRTIDTDIDIWGWHFAVQREPVEFLNLTNVGCSGLTLRGSGRVTVTVPKACHTGLDGQSTFTIDLGPSRPTDEPPGPSLATTMQVDLDRAGGD